MKQTHAAFGVVLLASCTTITFGDVDEVYGPRSTAPYREPTVVSASFAHTWNAAIAVFEARKIPISMSNQSISDRSVGHIATEQIRVPGKGSTASFADCGYSMNDNEERRSLSPDWGIFSIYVKGDSASSSVRVGVKWFGSPVNPKCVTTGVWEARVEKEIAELAERTGYP